MADNDRPIPPGNVSIERKGEGPGYDTDPAGQRGTLDDFKASVREFAQRIPESLGKAFESIQARVHAITVQVDDETQKKIDSLVEAGIFKNRSESAAYLIHEGIKARAPVFATIDEKIAEIERLRSDMQRLIAETPKPPGPSGE